MGTPLGSLTLNEATPMRNPLLVVALLFTGAMIAGVPETLAAQTPTLRYQIAGISCVPAAPTVYQQMVVTDEASIQFAQGNVGRLSMLCPIPFVGSFRHEAVGLTVLLKDPDGPGAAQVDVSLRRIARSDGSGSAHPDAQLSSSRDCAPENTGWQECVVWFQDDLDFDRYYYFVRVNVVRESRGQAVAFGGIRLEGRVL